MSCNTTFYGNTYNRYDSSFVTPNGGSGPVKRTPQERWRMKSEPERYKDVHSAVNYFFQRSNGHGAQIWHLGEIFRTKGFEAGKPITDPAVLRALKDTAMVGGWFNGHAKKLVARILDGDAAAVTRALDAKQPLARDMYRDLRAAAETGPGVTRDELQSIVARHMADGKKGVLSPGEMNALNKLPTTAYADDATASVAGELAIGRKAPTLSLLALRAQVS